MALIVSGASLAAQIKPLEWQQLPAIPDKEGFAGSFAGVNNGALIVAGGANFPDKRPWEGGTKIWYDSIFVLDKPNAKWRTGFKLPSPIGYGVSITCDRGILCIGGSHAEGHSSNVIALSWSGEKIAATHLPALPKPWANMCGALLDGVVYVAGGIERPDATNALNTFWALDISKLDAGWKELEPWPSAGRMFATAAAHDGSFFVFGGADLAAASDNKPVRKWLKDAYRYTPGKGWKRIADLPHPVVAAPSPAPTVGKYILICGGDDGVQVNVAPTEHRGFPRTVLAYDFVADKWSNVAELPFGLVTTACVEWNGRIVIPGGEARPGVRSTEVWSARNGGTR